VSDARIEGLARKPPPDLEDGRAASPWTRGSRAATPGQLWVQEEPILPVQGLPTSFGSVTLSSSPSNSKAVELPISESGVAAWGNGWEEDFLVFFFFSKDRKSEGMRMIRCCANT
jgi:hypothetical protein